MFGILVLTGGVGFLVSWALLHLGLSALGLTGYLLQRWNPAIDSIGDVLALFGRD